MMNPLGHRTLHIKQPPHLAFGEGCSLDIAGYLASLNCRKLFLVTAQPVRTLAAPIIESLQNQGCSVQVDDTVNDEPTIDSFEVVLKRAQGAHVEAVVGIGGGSVLDVAKLVAAMLDGRDSVKDVMGIGKLRGRSCYLACIPTTSGTGSEVSPNAILLDETDNLKKGVVSPWLVPDAAYVDPLLTMTVPPDVTAATGMDALCHCIEAFANRFAHPMIDLYALKGIELIGQCLEDAYQDGKNLEARSALSLGSLYGGMCLGPVNTGAVHALAYPLGGEFHMAHGVSNAMLLPDVLAFNMEAAPQRYARIALALGCRPGNTDRDTASQGIDRIKQMNHDCRIPASLSEFGVTRDAVERMARSALTVTRLLKNNVRELTQEDAEKIYHALI